MMTHICQRACVIGPCLRSVRIIQYKHKEMRCNEMRWTKNRSSAGVWSNSEKSEESITDRSAIVKVTHEWRTRINCARIKHMHTAQHSEQSWIRSVRTHSLNQSTCIVMISLFPNHNKWLIIKQTNQSPFQLAGVPPSGPCKSPSVLSVNPWCWVTDRQMISTARKNISRCPNNSSQWEGKGNCTGWELDSKD